MLLVSAESMGGYSFLILSGFCFFELACKLLKNNLQKVYCLNNQNDWQL